MSDDQVETFVTGTWADTIRDGHADPIGITVGSCRRWAVNTEMVTQQANTSGDEDAIGPATIGRACDL
jgi:hypothetical protein